MGLRIHFDTKSNMRSRLAYSLARRYSPTAKQIPEEETRLE
jgi:hypothetical protein